MSTLKVDTIATRTGSGNITVSNNIAGGGTISGTNLTASGTLGVTGTSTLSSTLNMSSSHIQFSGNISLPNVGAALFRPAADTIAFGINNGQRVSVNQHGLLFGTDTAAANALDDYEEGTFTPTFGGSGGNPTVSYAVQLGTYIKVGKMVQLTVSVIATGTPSGGSGDLIINGIPFTSKAGIQQAGSVAFTNSLGTASGTTQMTCNIEGGVSYLNVNSHEYSGPSSMSRTEAPAIQNSAPRIVCSICYEAA